jgi:hypothetical protein
MGAELDHCTNGYILRKPVFPWHASCAPDLVKYANVERMRKELAATLSERAGAIKCGTESGDVHIPDVDAKAFLKKLHV